MKQRVVRGVVAAVCGLLAVPIVSAEEPARAIPTLLIKGEVVMLDQNDPTAPLLKVKDRYGFETPIYLMPETKVTQGDQASTVESLSQGASVEVEYNFDINTAKRHAVSVKLSQPAASAVPAPEASALVAPETAPESDWTSEPDAAEGMAPAEESVSSMEEPAVEEAPSEASQAQ